jgi:hypothetical protein
MPDNTWDALSSAFGSELDSIRKTLTNEFNSLGLGELVDFVPHVYQLIRSMGGSDPLSLIRETAHQMAFSSGQTLVTQALESFLSPMIDPVQRWQTHKQNLSDALLAHWSTMDGRISQLYTTDQFRGPAANTLTDQHEQLKQHGKDLHNQLLDSNQADTRMLGSIDQAIQEKSSAIASLGPVGPLALLIALKLAPSPTAPATQAPPQWEQQLEKWVKQGEKDTEPLNPLDPEKPWYVRILLGIGDLIATIGLAGVAIALIDLALIIFDIYLLWLAFQPTPRQPRNLNVPQPQPVPTPIAPVNSADAATIAKRLNDQGYNITQEQVEELLREGYTEKDIASLLSFLASIYGIKNVGKYIDQFASYGKDGITIASIMSRIKKTYGLVLDPNTVDELLTTNMGEDTYFTEDEAFQILKDFSAIYKNDSANGSQEVTNAVKSLLRQNLDPETTVALADAFADYFNRMRDKSDTYYKPLPQALQDITYAISHLDFTMLNATTFKNINSHNKHIYEMGFKNADEYKQAAIDFMSGGPSSDVLQGVRPNGQIVRWNMDNGDFGIIDPKTGNVITYYKLGTGEDDMVKFLREINKTQGE